MTFKLLNISTYLYEEIHCGLLPYSFQRGKDVHISLYLPLAEFDEDIRKLLEMFFQLDQ